MGTILDHDIKGCSATLIRGSVKAVHDASSAGSPRFSPGSRRQSEYGARELKRTIHRALTQPFGDHGDRAEINPSANRAVGVSDNGEQLTIREGAEWAGAPRPAILIVMTTMIYCFSCD